jgi:uncharacterized protein YbaR (Trm112 family)
LDPTSFDTWLDQHLACPYEGNPLQREVQSLRCPAGHLFPVVHGIPVLLPTDSESTHPLWWTTPARVAALQSAPPTAPLQPGQVDPFVHDAIIATCGLLYRGMRTPLPRYPLPSVKDLPPGEQRTFLDVGGNWGRWGLSASGRGYRAVVVDPSLEAALAGQRIAAQLDRNVRYVVGDGRKLPFVARAFAVSFSYSVLQSLDKANARQVITEMARVTEKDGLVRVQMANILGIRRIAKTLSELATEYGHLLRGHPYEPWIFRVRAWTPHEIRQVFDQVVGPTTLSIDGFFSLNAQTSDIDLLKRRYAAVVYASRAMVALSRALPPLMYAADSLYADARNTRGG